MGLSLNKEVWEASTFSKNRERLLGGEIAQEFLEAVLAEARRKHWLSDERFVVDGTLIEAWASKKSYQPKDGPPGPGEGWGRQGKLRKRDLYESKTDPEARLCKKSGSATSVLSYLGHVLSDTRHGLVAAACLTETTTLGERQAAVFGWLKQVAGQRKTRFRGSHRVRWMFQFAAAAYNLVRMMNLEQIDCGDLEPPCPGTAYSAPGAATYPPTALTLNPPNQL